MLLKRSQWDWSTDRAATEAAPTGDSLATADEVAGLGAADGARGKMKPKLLSGLADSSE